MIRRLPDGRWFVDVEPVRGRRYRRTFNTKAEAMRFETKKRWEHSKSNVTKVAKDNRQLSEIVSLWYSLHGGTLSDSKRRLSVLNAFTDAINDPVARLVTPQVWTSYRNNFLSRGGSPKTMNNHLSYVRAVFNRLNKLGEIDYQNPLAKVEPLKIQERELSYLTKKEVERLLNALKHAELPHARMVTIVCLSTGCRWGEAENLTPERVRDGLITFSKTKSFKVRSIPVNHQLSKALHHHFENYGLFTRCEDAFRKAVIRAQINLPRGQLTHVLRHTFAAHFVMGGGNLFALQKILGHSTITMTMRYAHLAPDHLEVARKLNPLAEFRHFSDT